MGLGSIEVGSKLSSLEKFDYSAYDLALCRRRSGPLGGGWAPITRTNRPIDSRLRDTQPAIPSRRIPESNLVLGASSCAAAPFCPEFASEVVGLHTEKERVAENPLREGLVLISQRRQASAAVYKRAQADLLRA